MRTEHYVIEKREGDSWGSYSPKFDTLTDGLKALGLLRDARMPGQFRLVRVNHTIIAEVP